MIHISTPLTAEKIVSLRAGDTVLLSGYIYTARDAAHACMIDLINRNAPMPFDVTDQVIFYTGPTPAPPGYVIGSIGPTTSGRMDAMTPALLMRGLRGMIGKGKRSAEVMEAIKRYGAVYFAAPGGIGALSASRVLSSKVIAFHELGTEAVRVLNVEAMPLVVAADCEGHDYYKLGIEKFFQSVNP